MKKICILIPMHNEVENLKELYHELEAVTQKITQYQFQYLLIDDGSTDQTVEFAKTLVKTDPKIQVIELSRNFGKEVALTAGIQHLQNVDAAILMDADLQHPPRYIPEFIKKWEEGFEIVATRRAYAQKQPFLKRLGSKTFYKMINSLSNVQMVSQTTDFRLLDSIVIKSLQSFTERNRMVRGIIDWMGFKKTYIDFIAADRFKGQAQYSYNKLLQLAINNFTSFSLFPLKVAGYLGVSISLVFTLLFILMMMDKFWFNYFKFASISFIIVINSLLIGIVLSCLGLIALYIGQIHTEVINRPLFIVRKVYKQD